MIALALENGVDKTEMIERFREADKNVIGIKGFASFLGLSE